jgi:D-glycero-alpha-D-manno-heptose-7-phosphate kinase
MIISKTPFRVSFFGGGTDYPDWYRKHGGAVLATTINKYCYLACRPLPPFFNLNYRVAYSKIELTQRVDEIEHPSVRACLTRMGFSDRPTEIVHYADLPSRTGIGSSSSFTVGLLNSLHTLDGRSISKRGLADLAIEIEQVVLREAVGSQDQVAAAFGGLNLIRFDGSGYQVTPVELPGDRAGELQDNLMLVFTGLSRFSNDIAADQIRNFGVRQAELTEMHALVDQAHRVLTSSSPLVEFGRLLHESWLLKSKLSSRISNDRIAGIYDAARAAGATGGKLLGAGGGGFLLFYVEPDRRPAVEATMRGLVTVPFGFDSQGSRVIQYEESEAQW